MEYSCRMCLKYETHIYITQPCSFLKMIFIAILIHYSFPKVMIFNVKLEARWRLTLAPSAEQAIGTV